jgi:hypothetical protein
MFPKKGRKTNRSRSIPNKPMAIIDTNMASHGFIPAVEAKIKQI